jgi:hypothetical protein
MIKSAVVVLLMITGIGPLPAQVRRPTESPEIAAAAVLRADSMHDWRMLLALAHPAALLEFRRGQVRALQFEGFKDLPSTTPCMVRQMEQHNRLLLDSVFHVPSIDSLAKLAPESVFARQQRPWANFPAIPDSFNFTPKRVLVGHVLADDSTAYVIIEETYKRRPLPDWPERRPQIMTFRAYHNTWRSMLDPDIGGMSGSLFMSEGDCQ